MSFRYSSQWSLHNACWLLWSFFHPPSLLSHKCKWGLWRIPLNNGCSVCPWTVQITEVWLEKNNILNNQTPSKRYLIMDLIISKHRALFTLQHRALFGRQTSPLDQQKSALAQTFPTQTDRLVARLSGMISVAVAACSNCYPSGESLGQTVLVEVLKFERFSGLLSSEIR